MPRMLLVALLVSAGAGAARANPAEVFGFASRHSARAGAVAASADDFTCGYYNPAGLAFGAGKRVGFGVVGAESNLTIDGRPYEIARPLGLVFGAALPAPLGGPLANRLHIGFGAYLLPGALVRVIARLPDEPFYPYYDNRTQRLVILPALAVTITDGLAFGVGVNFLGTLAGQVIASEGATRALDGRVDEEVPTVARLHAGLRWRPPSPGNLDLALVFRQSFEVNFTTVAKTTVAGEPIDLDLEAHGLYTPDQVVGGAAWRPTPALLLSTDVTWARWSAYGGPFVSVRSALPLVGALAGQLPAVPYRDTWSARAGVEAAVPRGRAVWFVRGGYGFETSPFPAEQPGVTNLLDGPKHTAALGVGLELARVGDARALRIDLHGQAQLVGDRELVKRIGESGEEYEPFAGLRDEVTDDAANPDTLGVQISNPGYPSIRSGGQVLSAGLTLGLEL